MSLRDFIWRPPGQRVGFNSKAFYESEETMSTENCPTCGSRQVAYQGFNESAPSGAMECLRGCTPKQKSPQNAGPSGEVTLGGVGSCFFPEGYPWQFGWRETTRSIEATVSSSEYMAFNVKVEGGLIVLYKTCVSEGCDCGIAFEGTGRSWIPPT